MQTYFFLIAALLYAACAVLPSTRARLIAGLTGVAWLAHAATLWFDLMAIPADAPNPEAALAWINFIMDPQITADITNYVWYANANTASMPLVDAAIRDDPAIFPTPEVRAKLFPTQVYDARTDRTMTKLWTRAKTGQ